MKTPNKILPATAILLAMLLVGVIVQKQLAVNDQTIAVVLPPNRDCDLQRGDCASGLPEGGYMRFSIEPRPIPVLRPIKLIVTVQNVNASKVEVDFTGVSMKMGYNRTLLRPNAAGRFEGETTLPICSSGGMTWRATVLLEIGGKRVAVPFEFVTSRN